MSKSTFGTPTMVRKRPAQSKGKALDPSTLLYDPAARSNQLEQHLAFARSERAKRLHRLTGKP